MYANTNNEMSNENKTIHDFDFSLICDFFSNMERQGPGSPDVTLKSFELYRQSDRDIPYCGYRLRHRRANNDTRQTCPWKNYCT